jgi:hypothetical protein
MDLVEQVAALADQGMNMLGQLANQDMDLAEVLAGLLAMDLVKYMKV